MKKFIVALCFLFIFVLLGCQEDKIDFSDNEINIAVSSSYNFDIKQDVELNALDNTVLKVEGLKITALSVGETIIVISLKSDPNIKKEVRVNVIEAIDFSLNEIQITISSKYLFEIDQEVVLKSLNTSVVRVDGLEVTGLAVGNAVVEISFINYPEIKKEVIVKVFSGEQSYNITFDLDGGECNNLILEFNDGASYTLPTPTKEGVDFLGWYENDNLIVSLENRDYSLKAKWGIATPQSIEFELILSEEDKDYETIYFDTNCIIKAIIYPLNASQEVTWRASNKNIADILENGFITVNGTGSATFRVTSVADPTIKADITLKIEKGINPYKFLKSLAVNTPVARDMKTYTTDVGTDYYLLGSISYYLFEDIEITEMLIPTSNGNRPGKTSNDNTFKAMYVTVHDVGAPGDDLSNANYALNPTNSVSWHYTVGNNGYYHHLPNDEVGFHAGDKTDISLEFYDSLVKAPIGSTAPAVITIDQTTGEFIVNGTKTNIMAPKDSNDNIVKNTSLPSLGINNYVNKTTGTYMISKTYWNKTYNILSNYGGNLNSIGIESAINIGSNIYYTWQRMAKLIGFTILPQNALGLNDVKQHNSFSGKNCPQTMRRANMWEEFMKMVKVEYHMKRYFSDYTFTLECNSEYIKSNGVIKTLPETETDVTYKITMKNNSGFNEVIETKITLPARSTIKYKTISN